MRIKLIADSTCDLSEELIKKYDIRIVPLSVSVGDKALKDGVEITSSEIFDYVENGKGVCRTSAVNTYEYTDVYAKEIQNCDAILHFVISAELSSCYQNARIAAADFENIYIIDSRNLSTAIGHLVLDAAELAEKGMPASDIYEEITKRIALLDASFVIDTLQYLHKGGRCSAVAALASGLLQIKPCIIVKDGEMSVGKKYRGKPENVLLDYISDKLKDKETIDTRRIFITHTMKKESRGLVALVKSKIAEQLPFDTVYETNAGSTISCHCGPDTLGILFFRKG